MSKFIRLPRLVAVTAAQNIRMYLPAKVPGPVRTKSIGSSFVLPFLRFRAVDAMTLLLLLLQKDLLVLGRPCSHSGGSPYT